MRVRALALLGVGAALAVVPATASAQLPSTTDPRASLAPGLENAGVAAKGMELLAHVNKPPGWFDPANPGSFAFAHSDIAFQGNYAFFGGFNGFTILNIPNPAAPTIRPRSSARAARVTCRSTRTCCSCRSRQTAAKKDCDDRRRRRPTRDALPGRPHLRHLEHHAPAQVGRVQTCRGSHTHTLVRPKNDAENVYIYVSGTAGRRAAA